MHIPCYKSSTFEYFLFQKYNCRCDERLEFHNRDEYIKSNTNYKQFVLLRTMESDLKNDFFQL